MTKLNIPVSVLDLGPVRQGSSIADAIEDMKVLAKKVEELGYNRFWIAEHHNTPTLVSSATTTLMQHVLSHTDSIRVGSGGVMLPNHSPLVVAEQVGTLAQIYPDRLDLGLGRAPGTDMATAFALRRSHDTDSVFSFPEDIKTLQQYFGPLGEQGQVKASVAIGTEVPIYVLGSSHNSAYLAAELGLPYYFASHFAPRMMGEAIEIYRANFKPSQYLAEPYMGVCLNVIADETDEAAHKELTTLHQLFLNIVRGTSNPLMPPVESMDGMWNMHEEMNVKETTSMTFVGSKASVKEQFEDFQARYNVDEIMAISYIYDKDKQYRSYEIFKEIVSEN